MHCTFATQPFISTRLNDVLTQFRQCKCAQEKKQGDRQSASSLLTSAPCKSCICLIEKCQSLIGNNWMLNWKWCIDNRWWAIAFCNNTRYCLHLATVLLHHFSLTRHIVALCCVCCMLFARSIDNMVWNFLEIQFIWTVNPFNVVVFLLLFRSSKRVRKKGREKESI